MPAEEFYRELKKRELKLSKTGGWGHTLQLGRFNTRADGILGIKGTLMDARFISHPSIFADFFGVTAN